MRLHGEHPDDPDAGGWIGLVLALLLAVLGIAVLVFIASHDCACGAEPIGSIVSLPREQSQVVRLPESRPLLVLCGATWCSPCQQMETKIIPAVSPDVMQLVEFYDVDIDQRKDWANCLSEGRVPELILIEHGRRHCLVGLQTVDGVESFIRQWSK